MTVGVRGLVACGLVVVAAGVGLQSSALLLAGAVPLVYLGVRSGVRTTPSPATVTVDRTVEPTPAAPGRAVDVVLTVTNESDRLLPDVRVVDGVPERLAVTEGTPRGGARLEPGASLSVSYAVTARRGEYTFEAPTVASRSRFAVDTDSDTVACDGADRVVCRLDVEDIPVRRHHSDHGDGITADTAGDGIQFHSVREYRRGDPLRRVDWRHFAKDGELTTIDYHEEQSTTVVVVLDARAGTRVASAPGQPDAVELSAYAATHATKRLLASGHGVGLTVIGVEDSRTGDGFWIAPGAGEETERAITEALRAASAPEPGSEHVAMADEPTGAGNHMTALLRRLPQSAQVLWVTPALDDAPVEWVQRAHAAGHPGRVLSPNVVAAETVGGSLADLDRRARLTQCRAAECRVVDWRRETPLRVALAAAIGGDA
jgi:uncharacterized protein (DUF58 family)